MLDLVDIFGSSSEPPPSFTDPWNSAQTNSDMNSDPWDTVGGWLSHKGQCKFRAPVALGCLRLVFLCSFFVLTAVHSSTPVVGSPWMAHQPSSNTSNPWAPCTKPPTDPWEAVPVSSSPVNHEWDSPTGTSDMLTSWSFLPYYEHTVLISPHFPMQDVMGQIPSRHKTRRSQNRMFLMWLPLSLPVPQVVLQFQTSQTYQIPETINTQYHIWTISSNLHVKASLGKTQKPE